MKHLTKQFDELLSKVRDCKACEALPLGPKPIFQLSANSKILIAGQAPGRITHAKGIPFNDASGNRLRDWLGVSEEEFYDAEKFAILPMGFCFTGTGKSGDLPPAELCAQLWRQSLLDQVGSLAFTVIIGRYAMDWHLPGSKKLSVTEAVLAHEANLPEQIVLPHPSPRNNIWLSKNPWFSEKVIPKLRERVSAVLS